MLRNSVIETLFPLKPELIAVAVQPNWDSEWEISLEEVITAIHRIGNSKTLRPDGIAGKMIKLTTDSLCSIWANCFTQCKKGGMLPSFLEGGSSNILKKSTREAERGMPSSYRSICLFDEAGKVLEQVLISRLTRFLD